MSYHPFNRLTKDVKLLFLQAWIFQAKIQIKELICWWFELGCHLEFPIFDWCLHKFVRNLRNVFELRHCIQQLEWPARAGYGIDFLSATQQRTKNKKGVLISFNTFERLGNSETCNVRPARHWNYVLHCNWNPVSSRWKWAQSQFPLKRHLVRFRRAKCLTEWVACKPIHSAFTANRNVSMSIERCWIQ